MAKRHGWSALKAQGSDVVNLVIAYLKQETIGPLKDLGRYTAYGTIGSVFIGGGLVLLLVSLLRGLQSISALQGNLSWIPYLVVAVVAVAVALLAAWRITSGPARRRLPKPGTTSTSSKSTKANA
jgi:sugar phosphate permease